MQTGSLDNRFPSPALFVGEGLGVRVNDALYQLKLPPNKQVAVHQMVEGNHAHLVDSLDWPLCGVGLAGLKRGERVRTPLSASGEGLGVNTVRIRIC